MLGGQTDLPASVSALELRSSFPGDEGLDGVDNDPSAGSPTETLLRLHLPLNANVWITSHNYASNEGGVNRGPRASREHSIGRCDGRCVQRAGT